MWDSLGSKLAERWAGVSAPAVAFWAGGLLTWLYGRGGTRALDSLTGWLARHPTPVQIAVLLGVLLIVTGSGVVVRQLVNPVFALLEGYWPERPRALARLRARRVAVAQLRAEAADIRLQELAPAVFAGTATGEQRDEFTRVDRDRRRLPDGDRLLATRIGNTLRAAETRPIDKYGLDTVVVWPHLWLLFPESTRRELGAARRSLDVAVSAVVWGVLFVVFTGWAWWSVPLGLGVAAAALAGWVPARTAVFADLVEAAVDVHRAALYTHLRWPLPTDPDDERRQGRQITNYLRRGLEGSTPRFTPGGQESGADKAE